MFLSRSDFDDDGGSPQKPTAGQHAAPLQTPVKTASTASSTTVSSEASPVVVASPAIHRQRMAEQKQKHLDKRKSKNFVSGALVRTNDDAAGPRPTTPSSAAKVDNKATVAGGATPSKDFKAGAMSFQPSNTAAAPGGGQTQETVVTDMIREREKEKENNGVSQVEKSMLAMGISPIFDPVKKPVVDVKLDFTDMRSFLMNPVGRGTTIQCYIIRNKKGLKNKMYPVYELYLDTKDARFLLAAKKQSQNKTSYYLVSADKNALTKESASFMGKVRSNFMGTEFTVYDKGVSPKKVDNDQLAISMMTVRQELGYVVYESNLLGNRGPRKMTVALPAVGKDGVRTVWRPLKEPDTIGAKFKSAVAAGAAPPGAGVAAAQAAMATAAAPAGQTAGSAAAQQNQSPPMANGAAAMTAGTAGVAGVAGSGNISPTNGGGGGGNKEVTDLMRLENKAPKWNDQVGAFVLNFNGRVTMASVKNFQLVNVEDPLESVLLQFGRVEKDKFTMDFQYPLSPFQAFSICLSSFDYKIACE